MTKKQFSIRIEEDVINEAKKLAAQNKKKRKLPENYNQIIQVATQEYIDRNKKSTKEK